MAIELERLWEHIFSEDATQVTAAWGSLADDERTSVRALLESIVADDERVQEQRAAARFALSVVAPQWSSPPDTSLTPDLPPGALDFILNLVRQTGERLKYASGQLIASTKKDGSLVTASDIEADQHLGEAILARYPDHGILSEEGEKVFRGHEWCWVIDPIDGTTNFAWGYPAWGILIGLLHHGMPVLGVADFPPVGQQFYAARGMGAWRKTEIGYGDGRIHTARDQELSKTQLFVLGTRSLKDGRPKIPCKLRMPGSSGFDMAMLAAGACIGMFDVTVHVWDVAALYPIIEEAGGILATDHPGGLFPLRVGVDYSAVDITILGAGSASIMQELLARFANRFTPA